VNSLERVLATVSGTGADRPPLLLNLSLYGARLTGHPLSMHYTQAPIYVEGQIAARETFGTDFVTSPFLVPALGEAFGSWSRSFPGQAPNLIHFAAHTIPQALALPLPDLEGHRKLVYLRECIRGLKAHYPEGVPIVGILVSPVDLPALILGLEGWLDALLFDPEGAKALLERCTEFCVALGQAMLSDGATLLAFTANFANPSMVTPSIVEGIARPALERFCARLEAPLVLHHGGCRLAPFLEPFKGLPHVVAYLVDAQDRLSQAREALGDTGVLMGNLHGPTLDQLESEEAHRQCVAILQDRAEDTRFILASSAADIPLSTSPQVLAAIAESVRNRESS